MSNNRSLFYFFRQFPDEESCWKYLEERRWGGTPVCPHCRNTQKIYRYKNGKTLKCAHCKKQFSVKTGTIYENSNIPLQKWLTTFYLISLSKKGISSRTIKDHWSNPKIRVVPFAQDSLYEKEACFL